MAIGDPIADTEADDDGARHDYWIAPDADYERLALVGDISVSPAMLVELFGPPVGGDSDQISGRFVFERDDGKVFTLYDYKATSLYDDRQPSPEAFWQSSETQDLHIGASCPPDDFIDWLAAFARERFTAE